MACYATRYFHSLNSRGKTIMPSYHCGYYRKAGLDESGEQLWQVWEMESAYSRGYQPDCVILGTAKDAKNAIDMMREESYFDGYGF